MAKSQATLRPKSSTPPPRATHVSERIVDGDLVLYDARRQRIHVLNSTAAFVWRLCDGEHDQAAIASALVAHYPQCRQAIEEDVPAILSLFQVEGLLEA